MRTSLLESLTATVPDDWTSAQVAVFVAQEVVASSVIVNATKNWSVSDDERNLKILNDTVAGFGQACNEIGAALTELVNLGVTLIPGGTFVVSSSELYNGKVVTASLGFLSLVPFGKVGEAVAARIVFKDGSKVFIGKHTWELIQKMTKEEREFGTRRSVAPSRRRRPVEF